jgi:H+/gluconate symporter-like permease
VIAISHVINQRFVAPVYDVVANLTAFGCAVGASLLLGHWIPASLSAIAILWWLVLVARRTVRARSAGDREEKAIVAPSQARG